MSRGQIKCIDITIECAMAHLVVICPIFIHSGDLFNNALATK